MRRIVMVASKAYDYKDELKAAGFNFSNGEWVKETETREEWENFRDYARGRFDASFRPVYFSSQAEYHEARELGEEFSRISAEIRKSQKARERPISEEERAKHYVRGYEKNNRTKPYAKFAPPPFTGHEPKD